MPDIFKTNQALWYNVGVWGKLGYAVPNFGLGARTENQTIHYLVTMMGRNLSAIMHHQDADLRVPPSINTLTRVHKLIVRARSVLAGRAVPPGTPDFEAIHVQPGTLEQLIFPVPYFRVRNGFLREYCGLVLNCIAEACQHTENRKPYEISLNFAGLVGAYLSRVYRRMATELFQVSAEESAKPDFTLTAEMLASYNPAVFFTSTEMIDLTPPISEVPSDLDLRVLTDGIPATQLVGLCKYPSGEPVDPAAPGYGDDSASSILHAARGGAAVAGGSIVASSFAPPPGP